MYDKEYRYFPAKLPFKHWMDVYGSGQSYVRILLLLCHCSGPTWATMLDKGVNPYCPTHTHCAHPHLLPSSFFINIPTHSHTHTHMHTHAHTHTRTWTHILTHVQIKTLPGPSVPTCLKMHLMRIRGTRCNLSSCKPVLLLLWCVCTRKYYSGCVRACALTHVHACMCMCVYVRGL